MEELSAHLDEHYHRCVPLGWMPIAASGFYYPSYTIEYRPGGVWLRPLWLGAIFNDQESDPHIRKVAEVMDALTAAGMVEQSAMRRVRIYRLTPKAVPYYSDENSYGDNPEHLPFLCYTRLLPKKVVSVAPRPHHMLDVTFFWSESPPSIWANDYLRAHSVILPPLANPVTTTLEEDQYGWHIRNLRSHAPMLGHVSNLRAWSM